MGLRGCYVSTGWNNSLHGIGLIDGRDAANNASTVRPGMLENEHRYKLDARVEVQGEAVSIIAMLDEKPCTQWTGKLSSLSWPRGYHLTRLRRPALTAYEDQVTFHSAKFRLNAGQAFHDTEEYSDNEPYLLSELRGGFGGMVFYDLASLDSPLVGLRLSTQGVIKAIQPIYQTKGGPVTGGVYGRGGGVPIEVVARPGYAVGEIVVRTGALVDAMRLVFYRLKDGKLDVTDFYESEWIGGPGGTSETRLSGGGRPVIGLHGSAFGALDSIGLISATGRSQTKAKTKK